MLELHFSQSKAFWSHKSFTGTTSKQIVTHEVIQYETQHFFLEQLLTKFNTTTLFPSAFP